MEEIRRKIANLEALRAQTENAHMRKKLGGQIGYYKKKLRQMEEQQEEVTAKIQAETANRKISEEIAETWNQNVPGLAAEVKTQELRLMLQAIESLADVSDMTIKIDTPFMSGNLHLMWYKIHEKRNWSDDEEV
jgi:hypothetical protein